MHWIDMWHLFAPGNWPASKREDVAELWKWTSAVPEMARSLSDDSTSWNVSESQTSQELNLSLLDAFEPDRAMRAARRLGVDASGVVDQARAAFAMRAISGFASFSDMDRLLRLWPIAHLTMLASAAGMVRSWQREPLEELARTHFLTQRLLDLPARQEGELLWVPEAELHASGVAAADLRRGPTTEAKRRVVWKQVVRIRDRLSRTVGIYHECPRRFRHPFRRWWMAVLDVIATLESADFDLADAPASIAGVRRAKTELQAVLNRAAFKKR